MSVTIPNATMVRVESSFRQLASAAQALHAASEDLSKVIRNLDASLKKLALGFGAWVPVSNLTDETQYRTVELGYANVDGKWGLAIREIAGFHLENNVDLEEVWAFNDAPRTRRTEAVEKIPDLFEKLLQLTQETTSEIKGKIDQASDFNSLVSDPAPSAPPPAQQQWQRPGGQPAEASGRKEHEQHAASKPAPAAPREPQPLPMERVPADRSAAANTAGRFREEDPGATASVGMHAVPAGRTS